MRYIQIFLASILFISSNHLIGQSFSSRMPTVNENSLRPIHEADQMWKRTVWRRIDFKEKQNRGFYAKNNELMKYVIEGIKKGLIKAYTNDSLATRMSIEEFTKRIQVEEEGGGDDAAASEDDGFGTDPNAEPAAPVAAAEQFPSAFTYIELKEDAIFDKQRSRMYYDIQAINIILPPEASAAGREKNVCSISYKELVANVLSKEPNAVWYNAQNNAEHRTFVDALELKLYGSLLVKISNADNLYIKDIYNASEKEGLMASYWEAMKLMEIEHNMWEY